MHISVIVFFFSRVEQRCILPGRPAQSQIWHSPCELQRPNLVREHEAILGITYGEDQPDCACVR